MRVLGIYDKNDLNKILIGGKSVNSIMEEFWKRWPLHYRENYDKNLKTLELWKVDQHYLDYYGEYSDHHNLIIFRKVSSLIHELMHLSARDPVTLKNAFLKNANEPLFEDSLVEGYAEYLSCLALEEDPTCYLFETFVVSMLSNIDGIFEPYFCASYEKFINLFPYKKDIISLMYSLYYYANNYCLIDSYEGKEKDIFIKKLKRSIGDTINTLISIQLSFNKGYKDNIEYGDKLLGLIKNKDLSEDLGEIWEDYDVYTSNQVYKRILRRK